MIEAAPNSCTQLEAEGESFKRSIDKFILKPERRKQHRQSSQLLHTNNNHSNDNQPLSTTDMENLIVTSTPAIPSDSSDNQSMYAYERMLLTTDIIHKRAHSNIYNNTNMLPAQRPSLPPHSYSEPNCQSRYSGSDAINKENFCSPSNHLFPHSYPNPSVAVESSTPGIQQQASTPIEHSDCSQQRQQLSSLARLKTNFSSDQSQSVQLKKSQHQKVASDEDALATLPSPATSVVDLPTTHHIRHVRKQTSTENNAHYPHHLASSRTHSSPLSEQLFSNSGNHYNHVNNDLTHIALANRLARYNLPSNTEMIGRFAITKGKIGEGSFSQVQLALDLANGEEVAIKMTSTKGMQDNDPLRVCVQREIEILRSIDYPSIVKLIDTVDTPTHVCLIMEYVPGGELFEYVADYYDQTDENDARRIFVQLLDVVSYLHNNNIVHRDLKLENILLDRKTPSPDGPKIKLTDFGLARFIDPACPHLTTRCGSEEYAAPEIIMAKPYDGRQTDMWALGIVLYALLVGYLPFNLERGQTRGHFFGKIARADYKFPSDKEAGRRGNISRNAKDLVNRLLQPNPQRRATLENVRQHVWLTEFVDLE
ncbi:3535_t:CDS:1 [Paraglomus occultum]|uniref:3535_t:CDS:1 n=1 Tax=Paraglomus occultum TaxID=144539 RepID=A0A9N9A0K8_9GLOM|nr:3535_t:CDS:1 [Paraglomus occultum]